METFKRIVYSHNISGNINILYEEDNDLNNKQELSTAYLKSKKCYQQITEYIEDLIYEGNTCWNNEYGRIDPDDEKIATQLPNFNSPQDFLIVTHYEYDVLYFKILPKDACYENCEFFHDIFHKTRAYDGYFRNENKNNLSKKVLDYLCIGSTTMIHNYNMRNEFIEEQIGMYFV